MEINKITFEELTDENRDSFSSVLRSALNADGEDMISTYLSIGESFSLAFCEEFGTLMLRVFDGEEYSFLFPREISERADVGAAIEAIVRYAVLEEIEPIFENVPRSKCSLFFDLGFRHINCDAVSPSADEYRVVLKNECALVAKCPEAEYDGVSLSGLTEADAEDYRRLVTDKENNKYWGYDFFGDDRDADGTALIEFAESEFAASTAVSFAIRKDGAFVGEAVVASFDYKGGADISIRILPEYQRKGYACVALSLLFDVCAEMGLVRLYARVFLENTPSLALFSGDSDEKKQVGEVMIFTYELMA